MALAFPVVWYPGFQVVAKSSLTHLSVTFSDLKFGSSSPTVNSRQIIRLSVISQKSDKSLIFLFFQTKSLTTIPNAPTRALHTVNKRENFAIDYWSSRNVANTNRLYFSIPYVSHNFADSRWVPNSPSAPPQTLNSLEDSFTPLLLLSRNIRVLKLFWTDFIVFKLIVEIHLLKCIFNIYILVSGFGWHSLVCNVTAEVRFRARASKPTAGPGVLPIQLVRRESGQGVKLWCLVFTV
jgi:hypothetical protein